MANTGLKVCGIITVILGLILLLACVISSIVLQKNTTNSLDFASGKSGQAIVLNSDNTATATITDGTVLIFTSPNTEIPEFTLSMSTNDMSYWSVSSDTLNGPQTNTISPSYSSSKSTGIVMECALQVALTFTAKAPTTATTTSTLTIVHENLTPLSNLLGSCQYGPKIKAQKLLGFIGGGIGGALLLCALVCIVFGFKKGQEQYGYQPVQQGYQNQGYKQ